MPPQPTRGTHILEAVADVLADEGLPALSIRTVARRAGVSVAQVQYYYRSRTELLRAALNHVGDTFLADLPTSATATTASLSALREALVGWFPLDEARERRARVWLAHAAAAVNDPELASTAASLDADIHDWIAQQLHDIAATGNLRAGHDAEAAAVSAAVLLALVDGLTIHALALPMGQRPAATVAVLDRWLDDLHAPADASAATSGGPTTTEPRD